MANISKNIKRLRTEKGITQESFSKMINVSRQAVSSWETGRTQPDIEMLGILSDALDVSIEELIYGERRNVKIDNEEKKYTSVATSLLSVLGGLMLIAGAVFILVWCWEHIPLVAKTVFAVVPILAGISCSVYVLNKMKDDTFMHELGASAWVIGNAVSVLFVNSLFEFDWYTETILLIIIILTIPSLFIMKSVTSLTAIYFFSQWMMASDICSVLYLDFFAIVGAVCHIIGILFTDIYKKKLGFSRHRYAQWISLFSVVFFVYYNFVSEGWIDPFVPLIAAFTVCYVCQKENDVTSPLYIFGTLGNMVVLLLSIVSAGDLIGGSFTENLIVSGLSLITFACGIRKNAEHLKQNTYKKVQGVFFAVSIFVIVIYSFVGVFEKDGAGYTDLYGKFATLTLSFCLFAIAVIFIIQGLKENKLYPLNLGVISIAALAFVIFTLLEVDTLAKGCVLLIMGGILMFMNLKITRSIEKEKNTLSAEVENADSDSE